MTSDCTCDGCDEHCSHACGIEFMFIPEFRQDWRDILPIGTPLCETFAVIGEAATSALIAVACFGLFAQDCLTTGVVLGGCLLIDSQIRTEDPLSLCATDFCKTGAIEDWLECSCSSQEKTHLILSHWPLLALAALCQDRQRWLPYS